MRGRIIKLTGGFYYVTDENGETHECKACGRFRKENIRPLVGDYVDFASQMGLEYGYIENIYPRSNELLRPPVANIDLLVLVVSASKPHIDLMLCDKLLIQAERAGIPPLICVNKAETNERSADEIKRQYAAYDVLCVSAREKQGIQELKSALCDKCVCLSGQSAVGKSSLINVLDDSLKLEVGGLSKKTARGKHTTRTTELLYIRKLNMYIFDTPGFSMFDVKELQREELGCYYREFREYADTCRFSSCMHDSEPGCGVKDAVKSGRIDKDRYERYLKIKEGLE